eukprot:1157381-Pelagomonas_calceolata.AAC.4
MMPPKIKVQSAVRRSLIEPQDYARKAMVRCIVIINCRHVRRLAVRDTLAIARYQCRTRMFMHTHACMKHCSLFVEGFPWNVAAPPAAAAALVAALSAAGPHLLLLLLLLLQGGAHKASSSHST